MIRGSSVSEHMKRDSEAYKLIDVSAFNLHNRYMRFLFLAATILSTIPIVHQDPILFSFLRLKIELP